LAGDLGGTLSLKGPVDQSKKPNAQKGNGQKGNSVSKRQTKITGKKKKMFGSDVKSKPRCSEKRGLKRKKGGYYHNTWQPCSKHGKKKASLDRKREGTLKGEILRKSTSFNERKLLHRPGKCE